MIYPQRCSRHATDILNLVHTVGHFSKWWHRILSAPCTVSLHSGFYSFNLPRDFSFKYGWYYFRICHLNSLISSASAWVFLLVDVPHHMSSFNIPSFKICVKPILSHVPQRRWSTRCSQDSSPAVSQSVEIQSIHFLNEAYKNFITSGILLAGTCRQNLGNKGLSVQRHPYCPFQSK